MTYAFRSGALLVAVAALGSACASAGGGSSGVEPQPRLDETSAGVTYELSATGPVQRLDFDNPADSVWAVLTLAYSALGIEGNVMDSRTRTYGVRRFTGTQIAGRRVGEFVRCAEGAGPSAVVGHRTELTIVSSVRALSGGRSALETMVGGFARRVDGTSTSPVRCESNGELERRIVAAVREKLAR